LVSYSLVAVKLQQVQVAKLVKERVSFAKCKRDSFHDSVPQGSIVYSLGFFFFPLGFLFGNLPVRWKMTSKLIFLVRSPILSIFLTTDSNWRIVFTSAISCLISFAAVFTDLA